MFLIDGVVPWPMGVRLIYYAGYFFDGIIEGLIDTVKPNERLNVTVTINAPPVPAVYKCDWRLTEITDGRYFGGK